MGKVLSTHVKRRSAYKILAGKSEKKTPLGRPRCRCELNTKMELSLCPPYRILSKSVT